MGKSLLLEPLRPPLWLLMPLSQRSPVLVVAPIVDREAEEAGPGARVLAQEKSGTCWTKSQRC